MVPADRGVLKFGIGTKVQNLHRAENIQENTLSNANYDGRNSSVV